MEPDDFKAAIETRLSSALETQKRAAPTAEGKLLLDRIHALILRGGKRARPLLLYLTYMAYRGADSQRLINLGVALEFHHQFLLIHDDLIDDDDVRYDGPNIVGYYQHDASTKNNGTPQAMGLLAGDLLFSLSHSVILKDEFLSDGTKVGLLQLINDTNLRVVFGEQLDSLNIDPDTFSEERQALISRLKTAHYTTMLPMLSAALLLGLDRSEQRKIEKFAVTFGILFQYIDDHSDYFDNRSAFNNRPKFRDYREGKVTYPLHFALAHASAADAAYLKKHLGEKHLSPAKMGKVVGILEATGAQDASRKLVEDYFEQTYRTLDKLAIEGSAHQQFMKLLKSYEI